MMAVLKGGYTYGEDGHVKTGEGTSLVVQGLRLHSQYAGPGFSLRLGS